MKAHWEEDILVEPETNKIIGQVQRALRDFGKYHFVGLFQNNMLGHWTTEEAAREAVNDSYRAANPEQAVER